MRILIVDDALADRRAIARLLLSMGDGLTLLEASTLEEARAALAPGDVDVALIDIRLSADRLDQDGLTLIREIRDSYRTEPIVVSGSTDIKDLVRALRLGAQHFILKDELSEELIVPIIEKLRKTRELESEVQMHRARRAPDAMTKLVGSSVAMQRLREMILRVAVSDRTVLVNGPTGSGKELVVAAIHALGPRPDEPFLDVNCGALPGSLIESQLFGHVKGAFTGADRDHEGVFTTVRKGTLFFDEIAELPLDLQAKLLRALESRRFTPVGSPTSLVFQGRLIAATHANLEERVRTGRFREDLFYRLNVLQLSVPGLEARREDIPALVAHFAKDQPRRFSSRRRPFACFRARSGRATSGSSGTWSIVLVLAVRMRASRPMKSRRSMVSSSRSRACSRWCKAFSGTINRWT